MNKTADTTPEGIVSAEDFLESFSHVKVSYAMNAPDLKMGNYTYSSKTMPIPLETCLKAMKHYARQVAEAVKRECAERADIRFDYMAVNADGDGWPVYTVDRDSIMGINVNDFIK